MLIPVTRDKDNLTEIIMLDLNDVLYMHMEDRNVVYHTLNEHFYHLMPSLSVLAKHSENHGFEKLDRINLVNMNKIEYFDDEFAKVYFVPEAEVSSESKSATVAFLNKGIVKRHLKRKGEK
jgi:DNA-binding LytR/AlgR family response regulator